MRLSFHVKGDEVVGAIEAGALSFARSVPYAPTRIRELTNELMVVLGRGGRRHTLSTAHLRRMVEVGGQLSHELVHPELAARLPTGDEAVFLQLDGALVAVPWELLHDGESFWCHRYDLGRAVQTPQAVVAKAATLPQTPLRMLVICADPRGDLPHVLSEGEALVERFDATRIVDATLLVDPSVEQVRRQLTRYDVVTPEQSGWHLADGKLTAAQIASMGGARTMPLLVFANACHSTRTGEWVPVWDGAEPSDLPVYGLANAFLLAGVRLYVGTQQEVVDGQSENLAIAFYEALARGAGAGQAMRVARRQVMREQGQQALAWASYVLYGDPALTPIRPSEFRAKDLLSASLREAKSAVPVKRPVGPVATTPARHDRRRRRRWLVAGIALSVASTLAALGLSLFLLLRDRAAPSSAEGDEVPQFVQGVEHAAEAPKVAIAASPLGSGACLRPALAAGRRFSLVGVAPAPVEALDAARAYARSVNAELVVFVKGHRARVIDVLTGDAPLSAELQKNERACADLEQRMARTFLGEGEVVAVDGERVTVNLGWQSRVTPGMTLMVVREGRGVGRLLVDKVEMDRCIAHGAARPGDKVRVPR